MEGYIHSFETFGTVDGPGIRFVVFMQGCPMRCKYCHNPDSQKFGAGTKFSAEEVAKKVLKYKSYLTGGVTVSGGEPLMQTEFVTELFSYLKAQGIHTALDTSAAGFDRENQSYLKKIKELLKYTDLVLLDIKHIDEKEHIALTGFSNKSALSFAKFLSEVNKDTWIRHVLVPGITDKDEYLWELKKFLSGLKNVKKVEVLPYHTMGEVKYEKLGIEYPLKGVLPPTAERIENAKKILNAENTGDIKL